jgi:hypothetical protein
MTPETEVSGYSNYFTFHCALFLSNNRPQYDDARDLALTVLEENPTDDAASRQLADELEAYVEGRWLTLDCREAACKTDDDYLAHELLTAALGRVDWLQIAEEWIATAKEG